MPHMFFSVHFNPMEAFHRNREINFASHYMFSFLFSHLRFFGIFFGCVLVCARYDDMPKCVENRKERKKIQSHIDVCKQNETREPRAESHSEYDWKIESRLWTARRSTRFAVAVALAMAICIVLCMVYGVECGRMIYVLKITFIYCKFICSFRFRNQYDIINKAKATSKQIKRNSRGETHSAHNSIKVFTLRKHIDKCVWSSEINLYSFVYVYVYISTNIH